MSRNYKSGRQDSRLLPLTDAQYRRLRSAINDNVPKRDIASRFRRNFTTLEKALHEWEKNNK